MLNRPCDVTPQNMWRMWMNEKRLPPGERPDDPFRAAASMYNTVLFAGTLAVILPLEQELSHPLNNAADSLYMCSLLLLHAPSLNTHAHTRRFSGYTFVCFVAEEKSRSTLH